MEHTIDAKDKVLGRVATEAALLLRGKDKPTFERHKITGGKVKIVNAGQARITPKKIGERYHKRYTGYPGGLRKETWEQTIAKKGYRELFRLAIFNMLPDNKLRPQLMKNLTITE